MDIRSEGEKMQGSPSFLFGRWMVVSLLKKGTQEKEDKSEEMRFLLTTQTQVHCRKQNMNLDLLKVC